MAEKQNQFDKMTKTPIPKLILGLSVPTILSMLVSNIYNMVDTAFVGKLGNSASGAVGVVFSFMAILQACGFMFGQGSGSMISRRLGNKEIKEAGVVASTGFFTAFGIAMILSFTGIALLDKIVFWFGSTETIAPYARDYIFWILVAAPFLVTSFTLNNILRYEGKAAYGMIGMMSGAVINIGGDALFMFVFKMGISGAGLSTAISQFISFCILVSMFVRGKTSTVISIKSISYKNHLLWDIVSTGFPSMLRQGLASLTTLILNKEAGIYGDEAVAAMSIVSRIIFFSSSIGLGIGQGFQPVSGFNYGAKNYSRVKKGYWFTFGAAETITVIMVILIQLFSGSLIGLFRDDLRVIEIGTRALRLQSMAQIVFPFCMVTEMMYQSTGKKLGATLQSASRSGLFFIPSLLLLAKFRGLAGIQEAQPVAQILSFPLSFFFSYYFLSRLPKDGEEVQK